MSSERPFSREGALCSPTVGSVNVREVPGYGLELTPFGGIKHPGLGYKEGVQGAMKSFTDVETCSRPWI
jgi:acyl-CoA reductase-like NAD-dependent aldehyde dehydrogenase